MIHLAENDPNVNKLWPGYESALKAAGVAHDFNNLLVGVVGNASLALEFLEPGSPAADLLQGVIKAGEQAAVATVVSTIRSAPRQPGSKFVVTESGRMVGSDEYLTKPFTKDQLLQAVLQHRP